MALPVDLTTIEVTGSFDDASGAAQSGAVLFTPTTPLVDSTGQVVVTQTAMTRAVTSGTMAAITLATTDNANLFPQSAGSSWAYTVTIAVPGAMATFDTYLPSGYGSTVDLTQLIPAATPPALSGPYVQSINGMSGTVVLAGTILASGTATLISPGTVIITDIAIPASAIPYAIASTVHGTQGILSATASAGSITVTSSNSGDTSAIYWAAFAA
jgi:hypothetical protein